MGLISNLTTALVRRNAAINVVGDFFAHFSTDTITSRVWILFTVALWEALIITGQSIFLELHSLLCALLCFDRWYIISGRL